MRKIYLHTESNIQSLIASMYLDINHYNAIQVNGGLEIAIDVDEGIPFFIHRVSDWIKKEVFVMAGDLFFKNHAEKGKWDCWKYDKRFQKTYFDELFQTYLQKEVNAEFDISDEWDQLSFNLDDFITSLLPIAKTRIELIRHHFSQNIHEDYMVLLLPHKRNSTSNTLPY